MAWVLQDENDRRIVAEIEKQSDRGAIVVAISFLERRLEETIKVLLRQDIDPELNGKFFKGYGPLASFAAKIDLGFLMQLYPDEMRLALHKFREIRNDAAHETTPISFELPSIRDRCKHLIKQLQLTDWGAMEYRFNLVRATRIMPSQQTGTTMLYSDGYESENFSLRLDPGTTKEEFFACIKVLLFHLHDIRPTFERLRLVLPPSLGKSE